MNRGSPNIEMDEHTFMLNRERAVDYLNSLDKVCLRYTYYSLIIPLIVYCLRFTSDKLISDKIISL